MSRPVVVLVTVLAVAAALFVVAKSLRKVQPAQLPPALKQAPPDTGYVFFRASIRSKVNTLAIRCRMKREELRDTLTPAQDSMSRACDVSIAAALSRIAAFDTVSRGGRKVAAESIKAAYDNAKLVVRSFTHSGLGSNDVSDDSLDRELQRLKSK